jgi:hypothetical protein
MLFAMQHAERGIMVNHADSICRRACQGRSELPFGTAKLRTKVMLVAWTYGAAVTKMEEVYEVYEAAIAPNCTRSIGGQLCGSGHSHSQPVHFKAFHR